MDAARASSGQDALSAHPPTNDEEHRESRRDETEGSLFFGNFLLAAQKKVTRSLPPGNKKTVYEIGCGK